MFRGFGFRVRNREKREYYIVPIPGITRESAAHVQKESAELMLNLALKRKKHPFTSIESVSPIRALWGKLFENRPSRRQPQGRNKHNNR